MMASSLRKANASARCNSKFRIALCRSVNGTLDIVPDRLPGPTKTPIRAAGLQSCGTISGSTTIGSLRESSAVKTRRLSRLQARLRHTGAAWRLCPRPRAAPNHRHDILRAARTVNHESEKPGIQIGIDRPPVLAKAEKIGRALVHHYRGPSALGRSTASKEGNFGVSAF